LKLDVGQAVVQEEDVLEEMVEGLGAVHIDPKARRAG
jgi:hypothetical protein